MRLTILSLATASATLAAGAPKPQGVVDATIAKAVKAYSTMNTSKGTFEQQITNPLTGSTVRARGTFEQQRQPARFAFRFTEPKGDLIVGDGRWLWVYLPSSTPGQVIKMPMNEGTAGNLDLASRFFTQPKSRFAITDAGASTVAGHATRALVLDPKSDREPFTRATVWIDTDDGTLRQFETVEASGLTRRVTVTAITPNAAVSAKAFSFSPPKGVRVVDQKVLGATR